MERPSSPLSERSYARAVSGSPKQCTSSPSATPKAQGGEDQMQIDSPRASSPEIPLSSMPMLSTQGQIEMEQRAGTPEPLHIEVDNSLGRASDDVNALLQNNTIDEGWQTVTPKKNRKKAKKAVKKSQDSNKRPHSDSPIKERMPKRQATENGSEISGDEGGYRRAKSPGPALSVSALDYTDEEESIIGREEAKRASATPKADTRPLATMTKAADPNRVPPTTKIFPERPAPTKQNHVGAPPGNQNGTMPGSRGESPMKISTPTRATHDHSEEEVHNDPDENDPELWFETTEGDITTNGKGFRRTAAPDGGWPKVYLAASPTFNIEPETLSEWADITEPAIWARLYRARYEQSEAGKTKAGDLVKNVIKNLVFVEHDEHIAVIFPEQDLPPNDGNRYPHPYHLLVVGLDPQQAQRLLDLEVVASPEATVFFLPRNPPRQLYILTMKGLTYNNTEGARGLVEDLAKRTFRMSPEIRAMIENHSNAPTEDAIERVLDIRASFLPIKQRPNVMRCWNLYFNNDPGFTDDEYRLLRKKMRACTFKTLTFGKGFRDGSATDPTAQGTPQESRTSQTTVKPIHTTRGPAQEEGGIVDIEAVASIEAEALVTPHE
ncbi:hypothetical protein C0992_008046, partial [Termitomyces sp. T32_za158]